MTLGGVPSCAFCWANALDRVSAAAPASPALPANSERRDRDRRTACCIVSSPNVVFSTIVTTVGPRGNPGIAGRGGRGGFRADPTPSGGGQAPTPDRRKTPATGSWLRGIDQPGPVTEV